MLSKEQARENFLTAIRGAVEYWEDEERAQTSKKKLEGLAFSILNIIDGSGMIMPALDICLSPHPDDKQYAIDNGEEWYEPGMCINDDVMLHEFWHQK